MGHPKIGFYEKFFLSLLKILSSMSIIFSANILNDGYNYKVQNILRDYGKKNWDSITCFNSLELNRHLSSGDIRNDSLKILNLGGMSYENNLSGLSLHNFIHFNFKNFYTFIYILNYQKMVQNLK